MKGGLITSLVEALGIDTKIRWRWMGYKGKAQPYDDEEDIFMAYPTCTMASNLQALIAMINLTQGFIYPFFNYIILH